MLAACGGGDGDSAEAAPEVIESTLGYFDYDANSKTRVIRNDLTGSFDAMLQFGQSHVVDPNGNESKKNAASDDGKRSAIVSYAN